MDEYVAVLKKYAVFSGRARRREYWMFILINVIVAVVLGLIEAFAGISGNRQPGLLSSLYSLAVLLPSLGVAVRRLHDTGRSGWWLLINLIPLVGTIVLLVFFLQDSEPGENQYGPNPKEVVGPPILSPGA